MRGKVALFLTVVALWARPVAAAQFDGYAVPDTLNLDNQRLVVTSCALREALFADLYLVALYLPPGAGPQQAAQEDLPKAFRIQVVYEGEVPEEAPEVWQQAVRRELDREMRQAIREAYQGAETGDVITVRYAPGTGTIVTMNGQVIERQRGAEGMQSILQMWLGENAVSPNMRRLLLTPGC